MKFIQTGSKAFFSSFKDFHSKDTDFIILVEPGQSRFEYKKQVSFKGKDEFYIVRRPKDELIAFEVEHSPAMSICHYLIPEFATELGLEISDLAKLKPLRDKLDEKHAYLGLIYDAYIANGEFTITEEQLNSAYECYKSARPNKSLK